MRKRKTIAAALAVAIAVTTNTGMAQVPPATPSDAMIEATIPRDATEAIAGINAFSLDLYRRAEARGGNALLSPASVSTAMALAYRGAAGKTADELRTVLHYDAPPASYLQTVGPVVASMNFEGTDRTLQTINSLWIQEGMRLKPDYQADVQHSMKAGLQRTDFRGDSERSRLKINRWVATASHDRITDLLGPGMVTQETRAVLVNAVYWKGLWYQQFAASDTASGPFTLADGTVRSTQLMHQQHDFAVVERDGVQAVALPYAGGEVEMVVFLPKSADRLPAFEQSLTAKGLDHWLASLRAAPPRDTVLTLPRLHLEWNGDLADIMAAMGAPTPFSDDADFKNMVALPYPGERSDAVALKIGHVIHKAWLDVDEGGTEAAAATAVLDIIVTSMRVPPPPPPVVFRADHPFFFLLRDRRTGLILFMGRYAEPPVAGNEPPGGRLATAPAAARPTPPRP